MPRKHLFRFDIVGLNSLTPNDQTEDTCSLSLISLHRNMVYTLLLKKGEMETELH